MGRPKKAREREEKVGNLISPAKGRGTELARWRGYFFYQNSIKLSLENRRFSRDFFTFGEIALSFVKAKRLFFRIVGLTMLHNATCFSS